MLKQTPFHGSVSYQLTLPPSANRIWRFNRHTQQVLKSMEYRRWLDLNQQWLVLQGIRTPAPPVRVTILIEGGVDFAGHNDLDNRIKPVLDLLHQSRVLNNDNVNNVVSVHAEFVRTLEANSHCTVTIESLTGEVPG